LEISVQHRVVYPGFHNAHNMRAQISTYRCNSQSRKESQDLIAPQKVDIQNKIWVLNYFSGARDHLYTCRIGVLWVHCIRFQVSIRVSNFQFTHLWILNACTEFWIQYIDNPCQWALLHEFDRLCSSCQGAKCCPLIGQLQWNLTQN